MNRHFTLCLFLILVSGSAFADCVGYTDIFDVRVLDAKYRPIPDANVTVKYDRGALFGEQYFTTPIQLTNGSGMAHFEVYNQGTLSRPIDCKIIITGSVGGSSKVVTVTANVHGTPVDVALGDVYPVKFYVKDQFGVPIPNASVMLGGAIKKTGSDGIAEYRYKKGSYTYFASYMEASQAGTLSVVDDTNYEVLFSHYRITIDVIDDFGEPLNATLTISNSTSVLENGHYENNKTFGEEIPYVIDYQGRVSEGKIIPAENPVAKLTYDIHSPLFDKIEQEMVNNRPKLTITVSDPGQFSSGVDFGTFKATYNLEQGAPWSQAVTYTSGRNTVAVEFPELPENSIVQFRAEIKDKAGNKATVEAKFSATSEQPPQNNTQNQTGPPPQPDQKQEIPLIYIVGGVIITIIAIYIVIRIKYKPGGASQ